MKRLLLVLCPWMAVCAAAQSEAPRPAEVLYAAAGSVREGVFRSGDECLVEPDAASAFGWSAVLDRDLLEIRAEGQRFKIQAKILNSRPYVPMREVVKQLGGLTTWKGEQLEVLGVARFVRIMDGELVFESTLPAKPRVFSLQDPARVVIDFQGVVLDSKTRIELGPNAKASQHQPGVVRLTYQVDTPAVMPKYNQAPTKWFEYNLNQDALERQPDPASTGGMIQDPETNLPEPPAANPAPPSRTATLELVDIGLVKEVERTAELRFRFSGNLVQPPTFKRPDPASLEIHLPGVRFKPAQDLKIPSASILSLATAETPSGMVLTLRFARPMGSEIVSGQRDVGLTLYKPNVGDGRLAGKIVVVDAGHGGTDSGARSPAKDVSEKNLTLAISKLVSERLQAEGATVIMTRKTDVFIPLQERAEIANRNGAHLFVSVHINSNRAANSTSGGMTFHHKQDPIGKLLAECVQREIAKVSKLPSLGVWSDQRIYQSGFAVLRYSKMPAILIELGFINHSKDRKRMLE
ncbi:MAG TPA: N-acetylmuramoyl-L-alanine amidase, partial [Fimbriimonadaceae bacterium]|nr:N-acetylmuramoyl-L-alanine amidase [Fimbriimonadaceae bacterium]